jgi:hypothetical protein
MTDHWQIQRERLMRRADHKAAAPMALALMETNDLPSVSPLLNLIHFAAQDGMVPGQEGETVALSAHLDAVERREGVEAAVRDLGRRAGPIPLRVLQEDAPATAASALTGHVLQQISQRSSS